MTRTETALRALATALAVPALPVVRRNSILDDVLEEMAAQPDTARALVLRDGETEISDTTIGDGEAKFSLVHRAELEWIVAAPEGEALETAFDDGLAAIAAAVRADPQLGGGVDLAELRDPPERDLDVAGAKPAKTARLLVTLEYQSADPF